MLGLETFIALEGDCIVGFLLNFPVFRNSGNSAFSLTPHNILVTGSPISRAMTVPIISPKLPEGMDNIIGSPFSAMRE